MIYQGAIKNDILKVSCATQVPQVGGWGCSVAPSDGNLISRARRHETEELAWVFGEPLEAQRGFLLRLKV